ncbi:MAG TPA: response regulator transcription factor [Verrucomicrobiae bacterium]|nr:response regulator transcription factor [Verrucomicrobiae bacterium]
MAKTGNHTATRQHGNTAIKMLLTSDCTLPCLRSSFFAVDALHKQAVRLASRPLRVIAASADQSTRLAIEQVVKGQTPSGSFEIYPSPSEVLRQPKSPPPTLVLVDFSRGGASMARFVGKVRCLFQDIPVIALVPTGEESSILPLLMAGAMGCLVKPVGTADLAMAVAQVTHGRLVLCKESERVLVGWLHRMGRWGDQLGLTPREREVMAFLAEGLNHKEVGKRMGISAETVHAHLVKIFKKLGAHDATQAIRSFLH